MKPSPSPTAIPAPALTTINLILAGIAMKDLAIVLIMLLRLDALQRFLSIVIELIIRWLLLLLLFILLLCILIALVVLVALALTARPWLPLSGGSCHRQTIALRAASALLEALAARREATWSRTRRGTRLGQYIGYGGYLLRLAAIGKQTTLQIVGKDLLRYLILARQLALIQLNLVVVVRAGAGAASTAAADGACK